MKKHKFLTVMVVGDNPEELMEQYRMGELTEPILQYKIADKDKYLSKMI